MKVVHIVRQYLPSIGGLEEVVRNLAQYQRKESRYQPRILTLNRLFREPGSRLPAHEIIDGVPVERLPYRGSERYPLCPKVLGHLRDADLIHVHGIDFFFDFLALTRPIHGKPLIASTHGGFFHSNFAPRLKQIYFKSVTRLSARAYRRIISTSENDGEIFRKISRPPQLEVIENGVDIRKFDNAASATFGPTLIYFGRWSENKGLPEVLDILAALRVVDATTPWQLIIAGREYDLDERAIRERANILGIGDRLTLVPAPSNETLQGLIARASYFICMSHHEGFGIAPIEAMSAGLFPILSAIPPFRRLVGSSGIGLILEAASPIDQANHIARLHASHLRQASPPRQAARLAAAPYSWQGVAARYVASYDQVLAAS
jgi:alpha-1,3-mannosyltransferase